ncbi:MAG TPA: hypothetical protein PL196_05285, partial [Burkholderiaceae bacterium]|nr:hypothetical protein [Burkholderiaceae bacterium]
CYTLSAAIRSGRPIAVFDLGAQARRVRALSSPSNRVLPLGLADDPERLVRRLLAMVDVVPDEVQRGDAPIVHGGNRNRRHDA